MTDLKYGFSGIGNSSYNPLWGAMVDVNNATSGLLAYSFLILAFTVSLFVFVRRTQDTGKSLLMSCYITSVLAITLYYAGKVSNVDFVPEILLLGLLVLLAGGIALARFLRSEDIG